MKRIFIAAFLVFAAWATAGGQRNGYLSLMKTRFSLCFLATALFLFCHSAQAQVVVIANASVKGSDFSTAELRDIFTGASSTLKGNSVVGPVLLKQGITHEEFLSHYVGKSDSAFRASWRSLIFSGQGTMPHTVDSEAAVVEYVAHTPGSVGYISRNTPHEGVKTLAVRESR